jgi:hypothetical protein
MEMAHNMLASKNLSDQYWAEAVAPAVYIMKRCPKKSVKNRVPKESWTGMKHNVVHLIFFCCVAYTHVPDEPRKKIDNK